MEADLPPLQEFCALLHWDCNISLHENSQAHSERETLWGITGHSDQ